MYFMSDPQALHVTRNVIPGKLGVDLHLHRVHIPLVVLFVQFSLSNFSHWLLATKTDSTSLRPLI